MKSTFRQKYISPVPVKSVEISKLGVWWGREMERFSGYQDVAVVLPSSPNAAKGPA